MDKISNSILTVEISEHGAELQSIKKNGKEYLWQGDAKFWGRRSPVLFPNVGRVWENKYRHAGNISSTRSSRVFPFSVRLMRCFACSPSVSELNTAIFPRIDFNLRATLPLNTLFY